MCTRCLWSVADIGTVGRLRLHPNTSKQRKHWHTHDRSLNEAQRVTTSHCTYICSKLGAPVDRTPQPTNSSHPKHARFEALNGLALVLALIQTKLAFDSLLMVGEACWTRDLGELPAPSLNHHTTLLSCTWHPSPLALVNLPSAIEPLSQL